MTEFRVPRTGDAPLKFHGELIAEASSRRVAGGERNRWYEITVYRTEKGKWVVSIAYRTMWQGEQPHDQAEAVADAKAVMGILRADYDPVGRVRGFPDHPTYADKQSRLLEGLLADYGQLISEISQASPEFAESVD